jgi:hypothetical protein
VVVVVEEGFDVDALAGQGGRETERLREERIGIARR